MKHLLRGSLKRAAALLLAAACLTACGGPADEDEPVGQDWRVQGIVDDYGTIVRNDEEIPVCICIHDEDAAFYYDQPEQVYYDGVTFPMAFPDAADYVTGVMFDDRNGDGQSDVTITLELADGSAVGMVWYWDEENGFLFAPEDSSVTGGIQVEDGDISPYVGLWQYEAQHLWLNIHEDASWEFLNSDQGVTYSGTAQASDGGVELFFEDNGDTMTLIAADGVLLDREGNQLVPVEEIVSTGPYFEENTLSIDGVVGKGSALLPGAISNYRADGSGYTLGDAYWEVTVDRDDTHDGIRDLEFTAVCYLSESSIPLFDTDFTSKVFSELCDYYTGVVFPIPMDDDHLRYSFEWQGEMREAEFFITRTWEKTGDWFYVFTKHFNAYLPAGYDGLIFAAMPAPNSYANQLEWDRIDEEKALYSLTDLPSLDPHSCLFFPMG